MKKQPRHRRPPHLSARVPAMSANKAGKGSEGDDAVDSNSIAVLEPKVEIPLVDSTATLLTQSEKQTAAETDAPRPIDGEDVDGFKDRAATGRAERSMKQDFKRIIQESKGQTNRLMLGIFFLILTALCSMFLPYFAGKDDGRRDHRHDGRLGEGQA